MTETALALAASMTADPYPQPDYRVCHSESDIYSYLNECHLAQESWLMPRLVIAEDTESIPGGAPYCVTFSAFPGTARLAYVRNRELIDCYGAVLSALPPHQLFHNYLHDREVFDALALHIDPEHFTDTMVRAYNLCLGGGGDAEDGESRAGRGLLSLKVLAYRHCQMRMQSFADTVHPHSIPHVQAWLRTAHTLLTPAPAVKYCTCGHSRVSHVPRGKTGKTMGKCTVCDCTRYKLGKSVKAAEDKQAQALYTKLGKLVKAIDAREQDQETGEPVNPWKRIEGWHDWDKEVLEALAGPTPQPSIAYVPESDLLNYACRDADATLRLWLHMRRLIKPWVFYTR